MAFALVLDARCRLGESPIWSATEAALYFVDIEGRALHRFDPRSRAHQVWPTAEDIACIAPTVGGGLVAGMRSGVWRLDGEGRQVAKLADNPEDVATSRFNDGGVDPRGRFVLGTLDESKTGKAHLYVLDGGGLRPLVGGLITSNGVAFSPDGRTLYHADTPRFVVRAHDYDPASGTVGTGRLFVQLDPQAADRARPDGAAVDVEGAYWTALFDGGRVRRYSAEGRMLADYPLPARRPTMPRFGGPDLKTLYVTTAAHPDDAAPGGVYAMTVDAPGAPIAPFDPSA